MDKNFGRDFCSAMIGLLLFIISFIMDSLIWMIIGGAICLFFVFSIVIKVIIECEKDTATVQEASS